MVYLLDILNPLLGSYQMILEGQEVTKLLKVLNVHLQYISIFGNQQLLSDKLIGKCNIWSEEVLWDQGVYPRAEFFKSSTKLDVSDYL